ncbi:MAG TPA: class I SAM-dependent methyltransferase, partial [Verrucomicrobiae bacterium]|nr:class I SAM-dependent methyltransferase [Verrucomicrobiae bacterium]
HSAAEIMAELAFDWRHGVETTVPRELDTLAVSSPAVGDGVQYQGASPRAVAGLLAALPPEARAARFIDFGCGKGRVLLLAAEAGFERLTGIEFAPALAAEARRNLQRSRRVRPGIQAEVLTLDAAEYAIPTGPVALFFYNPFGGETLRRVVENVWKRANQKKESLWIIYLNPKGLAVFEEAGFRIFKETRHREKVTGAILVPL